MKKKNQKTPHRPKGKDISKTAVIFGVMVTLIVCGLVVAAVALTANNNNITSNLSDGNAVPSTPSIKSSTNNEETQVNYISVKATPLDEAFSFLIEAEMLDKDTEGKVYIETMNVDDFLAKKDIWTPNDYVMIDKGGKKEVKITLDSPEKIATMYVEWWDGNTNGIIEEEEKDTIVSMECHIVIRLRTEVSMGSKIIGKDESSPFLAKWIIEDFNLVKYPMAGTSLVFLNLSKDELSGLNGLLLLPTSMAFSSSTHDVLAGWQTPREVMTVTKEGTKSGDPEVKGVESVLSKYINMGCKLTTVESGATLTYKASCPQFQKLGVNNILDGNTQTYWESYRGSTTTTIDADTEPRVEIDMGYISEVQKIEIIYGLVETDTRVEVYISKDPASSSMVSVRKWLGDEAPEQMIRDTFAITKIEGRNVILIFNKPVRIYEINFYGKPLLEETKYAYNLGDDVYGNLPRQEETTPAAANTYGVTATISYNSGSYSGSSCSSSGGWSTGWTVGGGGEEHSGTGTPPGMTGSIVSLPSLSITGASCGCTVSKPPGMSILGNAGSKSILLPLNGNDGRDWKAASMSVLGMTTRGAAIAGLSLIGIGLAGIIVTQILKRKI